MQSQNSHSSFYFCSLSSYPLTPRDSIIIVGVYAQFNNFKTQTFLFALFFHSNSDIIRQQRHLHKVFFLKKNIYMQIIHTIFPYFVAYDSANLIVRVYYNICQFLDMCIYIFIICSIFLYTLTDNNSILINNKNIYAKFDNFYKYIYTNLLFV